MGQLVTAAKRLVAAIALASGLLWAWTRLPPSMFYGPSGPTRLGRATTRFMVSWSGAGMPPARQWVLEVRGRKSGVMRSLPVVVATVEGQRYLVSMLGERAAWVANARASGQAALRHGRREPVRLVEVLGLDLVPVLREYLRLAPGGRPHFPLRRDAPDADFAALVDRYPVFRVEPA